MEFKQRTLMQIADMICGNEKQGEPNHFRYRSSSYITSFRIATPITGMTVQRAITGSPKR